MSAISHARDDLKRLRRGLSLAALPGGKNLIGRQWSGFVRPTPGVFNGGANLIDGNSGQFRRPRETHFLIFGVRFIDSEPAEAGNSQDLRDAGFLML